VGVSGRIIKALIVIKALLISFLTCTLFPPHPPSLKMVSEAGLSQHYLPPPPPGRALDAPVMDIVS